MLYDPLVNTSNRASDTLLLTPPSCIGQDAINTMQGLVRAQHCREAAALASRCRRAHYKETLRHPQNLKHITIVECHQRRTKPRPQAYNMHGKCGKVQTCGSLEISADRQTDRQSDSAKLISLLCSNVPY